LLLLRLRRVRKVVSITINTLVTDHIQGQNEAKEKLHVKDMSSFQGLLKERETGYLETDREQCTAVVKLLLRDAQHY
jgi:hypothetical protein